MKASVGKLVVLAGILAAASVALYHYGGRYWAQQQVDRLVVKDEALRKLYADHPDMRREAFETAFIEAACGKDEKMAATFLRAGYSARTQNRQGLTPLHCAAATGNLGLAKDLVGKGADLHARTTELDLQPVHYAAWYRRWDLIRYLVGKGVSIDEPSKLGPPSALASNKGRIWQTDRLRPEAMNTKRAEMPLTEIVKELMSLGAAVDRAGPDGTTLMHWAALQQDVALMELLATKGRLSAKVTNQHGQTPLMFAFAHEPWKPISGDGSHVATVKWLVDHGADVNARNDDGDSIALHAVYNPEFLQLLPALDLNVADDKGNSIWTVLGYRGMAFAKTRPTIGVPLMADGRPGRGPLHVYAKEAQAKEIDYFLQRGVDPNLADQDGVTPLHEVLRSSGGLGNVRTNRLLIVKALLAAGADVNARTAQGLTPLMLAIDQPAEVIVALLQAHADINAIAMENGQMMSVLDRFVRRANIEGIELLVKAGARTGSEKWSQPRQPTAAARQP